MILPARSVACWSGWTSICPIGDFAFGSLSPELGDVNLDSNPQVPQFPDAGVLSISCGLNPLLFQDDIPKDQEGRTAWTKIQRIKASSCDVLQSVDELLTWVSH